jgi:hypothetical protein
MICLFKRTVLRHARPSAFSAGDPMSRLSKSSATDIGQWAAAISPVARRNYRPMGQAHRPGPFNR